MKIATFSEAIEHIQSGKISIHAIVKIATWNFYGAPRYKHAISIHAIVKIATCEQMIDLDAAMKISIHAIVKIATL